METNAEGDITHEFPEDPAGIANVLGENFNPHGLTVDWQKNVILTSDFIVPLSILKPTLGKVSDNTLRLWNLSARKIISTITIPNVGHFAVRRLEYNTNSFHFRVAVYKMSSSFLITQRLPRSRPPFI